MNVGDSGLTVMAERFRCDFKQPIPERTTPTTEAPATRYHALNYPDRILLVKIINQEREI